MILEDEGTTLDGVGFGLGSVCDQISPASKISVIGELSINEWNNRKKPQIFFQDLAVHTWQLFDSRGSKELIQLRMKFQHEQTKWIVFHRTILTKLQKTLGDSELIYISTPEVGEKLQLDHCQYGIS